MFKCRTCSVIKKTKQNVKWPTYIRANDYVSDKTNFISNESILQKKPDESDFHFHARTRKTRVYFFETFQTDFIDYYVNEKKTFKKNIFFFSVFFIFDMPRNPPNLRERAIGMFIAGMAMNAVAMNIGYATSAI